MTSLELALSLLVVLQFISLIVLYFHLRNLKALKYKPQGYSMELTEFLNDQKELGYSFVRVDPASVIIRSPRG